MRLFALQVINGERYTNILVQQHFTKSTLKAERGHVFMVDSAGKPVQLTENVELFTLYVDPKFVLDKPRMISFLTPLMYQHFCMEYGIHEPDMLTCVKNIEAFSATRLLPEKQYAFYYSGDEQVLVDDEKYDTEVAAVLSWFTQEQAMQLITMRLDQIIQQGIKPKNYLWFYENQAFLDELKSKNLSFVEISDKYYVYIIPTQVTDRTNAVFLLYSLLKKYWYEVDMDGLKEVLTSQENRYVRIATNMNAKLAKRIKDAKRFSANELVDWIPVYHGLWLEPYERRYYPFESFAAHILWFLTKDGVARYGVEEYFNNELAGQDGKIIGLATPWIGQIGSNTVEIEKPQPGMDVYLTIDPHIQKELERILVSYFPAFRSDNIAAIVIEPSTGKIKAMWNYPTFNPNRQEDQYKIRPLGYEDKVIADDLSYIDWPILILSGEDLRIAKTDERADPNYKKYIFSNGLWPQIFINRTISMPYEPGSIFKPISMWAAVDSDALSIYDFYNDPGKVQIGPYTIANVSSKCMGDHNFMHALAFSCNVGMVRVAQKMSKYVFYNYLSRLGFGQLTNVELAWEEAGSLPDFNTISVAWFYNNTYGQWLLATPIQMAAAYSALVNWGTYIQPTVIEGMYDKRQSLYIPHVMWMFHHVFRSKTSDDIKEALVNVIENGQMEKLKKPWYKLGGKTGTSEIAFRWEYKGDLWWTNTSLVGMITKEHTKYIVVIQVRRPRSSKRWLDVNGDIFTAIADMLIAYDHIEE